MYYKLKILKTAKKRKKKKTKRKRRIRDNDDVGNSTETMMAV